MTLDDVRIAARKHQERTGSYPILVGLHPADFEHAQHGWFFGARSQAVTYLGVRVIPCPDTEPGVVEVLRP